MQNYIYRIFFDKTTGVCLHRYAMEGSIVVKSIEQDIAVYLPDVSQEAVTVKEIPKNDTDTQDKLKACYSVTLDVATNVLVFDFNFPEPQQQAQPEQTPEERIVELEALLYDATSLLVESGVL